MLPLLVSACVAPLVMGCISDRMGGRRKPLVYAAGLIMIVCNVALAFNRSFGWLPYIGMLFGAVRASHTHASTSVPARVLSVLSATSFTPVADPCAVLRGTAPSTPLTTPLHWT
jgi:MFS family permease